jgi:hypothetical protein
MRGMKTQSLGDLYELSSDGVRAWLNHRKTEKCAARFSPHLMEIMGEGGSAEYKAEKVEPGVDSWPRFREMVKESLGLELPTAIPAVT